MNELTEDDRKVLTEYIGECWHEWIGGWVLGGPVVTSNNERCRHCGIPRFGIGIETSNRTFTTAEDLRVLVEAANRKGHWDELFDYFTQVYDRMLRPHEFHYWMITNPARTCKLAAEWIRGRK